MIIDEMTDLNEAERELERTRGHVAALERAINAELARRTDAGNIAATPMFQKPRGDDAPNQLTGKAESSSLWGS